MQNDAKNRETRVLIASDVPDRIGALFNQRFPDIPLCLIDRLDVLEAELKNFNPTVILAYPGEPVPKDQFPKMLKHPSVAWLSNCGAGVEHIGAWDMAQKTITNASGVNAEVLSQYVIAALMSANLNMLKYIHMQRARHWERLEWVPLDDRQLCIVGLGNIGRAVASHAKHFGLHVVGTRSTAQETKNVDQVFNSRDLHDALAGSDFVSVHTAHTSETEGMFNDAAFAAMPDGVIFLNASRGPVVDEDALMRALDSGKISTAILDVFQTEPLPVDHPLWGYENVIVTPHMSDSVTFWQEKMARAFCDNLDLWLKGAPMQNIIDPVIGY